MSIPTEQQNHAEMTQRIKDAIETNNATELYILARLFADNNDDETAYYLVNKARLCLINVSNTVNGITRNYYGDFDQIITVNWNEKMYNHLNEYEDAGKEAIE